MKITGSQIRAARAFLRWTIADLAKQAGVSAPTIQLVEQTDGVPTVGEGVETTRAYRASARAESMEKIAMALGRAGITFLADDGRGVGLRRRSKPKS